jgi:hypothetical protein
METSTGQQPTKPPTLLPKYEIAGDIHFSINWNRKLQCKFFTTIRLCNYAKYHLGRIYKIFRAENYCYDARVESIRYCTIDQLPDFTCYLDTGYSKEETIGIFKKMYLQKNINWETQLMAVILLQNLDFDQPK